MDRITENSILFDIYGGLLTEKKRQVMELYYEDDLSLAEIADEQGISRAAVHDALKSAENNLREYENHLKVATEYRKRQEMVEALKSKINTLVLSEEPSNREVLKEINQILDCLEE